MKRCDHGEKLRGFGEDGTARQPWGVRTGGMVLFAMEEEVAGAPLMLVFTKPMFRQMHDGKCLHGKK